MADFIQLKEDNILRVKIIDSKGKETGEHLEFDLEDIELPLRLNRCEKLHRDNAIFLKNQYIIIDKKQDKKGKFLLSANEEAKIKALNVFYKKEEEALDLFLGEGGTKKILNGRKPYYNMYDDISEILKPVLPELNTNFDNIKNKIKEKYTNTRGDVIE